MYLDCDALPFGYRTLKSGQANNIVLVLDLSKCYLPEVQENQWATKLFCHTL